MARFFGKIGYSIAVEKNPGKIVNTIVEKPYYGDVISHRWENQDRAQVNDDINISNEISIVGDLYAYQHFGSMVYVEWYGQKWKINSIDVEYPRLTLTIGGVYNGSLPS